MWPHKEEIEWEEKRSQKKLKGETMKNTKKVVSIKKQAKKESKQQKKEEKRNAKKLIKLQKKQTKLGKKAAKLMNKTAKLLKKLDLFGKETFNKKVNLKQLAEAVALLSTVGKSKAAKKAA